MIKSNCIKAINFDLDTKLLKEYYPKENYKQGYKDLKNYMIQNGYQHRQWSGYISDQYLSDIDTRRFCKKLNKTLPWLKHCVKHFDVTNVSAQSDMMYVFNSTKTKLYPYNSETHKENERKLAQQRQKKEKEQQQKQIEAIKLRQKSKVAHNELEL